MIVDKSDTRVRRMFGEIAGRYDLLNRLLSLNTDRYWRRQTVRKVPPRDERPILDVCSGTGDLALAYHRAARKAGLDIAITAADFCPEMLDIGRAKAEKASAAARIAFVEADAQELPFPDDRFQIVCVAFGLRNVADTDRGLAEMARVCGAGGRVAVLEFSMPERQPMRAAYGFYFRNVLPRIGQWVSRNGSAAYEYLPASVGEFPQGEALVERMRRAGLVDVTFVPLTCGVATLYVGTKVNSPCGRPHDQRISTSK